MAKTHKIQIGPYKLKVQIGELDTGDCGYYAPSTKTIKIDENQTGADYLDTYIHELIEAINHIYQLGMPHEHIQTLGICLAQAFISNPKLLSCLLKQACSER